MSSASRSCLEPGRVASLPPIGRPQPVLAFTCSIPVSSRTTGRGGELFIGGTAVGRGYLADGADRRSTCCRIRFRHPGRPMYRTGTSPSPDRRSIDFLGRRDSQVKIRGFRVELEKSRRRFSANLRSPRPLPIVQAGSHANAKSWSPMSFPLREPKSTRPPSATPCVTSSPTT